jgi:hypothetical protein
MAFFFSTLVAVTDVNTEVLVAHQVEESGLTIITGGQCLTSKELLHSTKVTFLCPVRPRWMSFTKKTV